MSGSTGSLVLGVVGASVGSMFGMTSLGWSIGSMVGGALFAEKAPDVNQEGPRLSDLKIQTSTYGSIIPDLFGTFRISGNVIYTSGIRETQHTESQEQGKGGGGQTVTQTNYTYSVDCIAISLCKGKTKALRRIWANGVLVYDISTSNTSIVDDLGADIVFYNGSEEQLPDSTIEGILGVGNCPAYRGISYVVLSNLDLGKYGNALPNFTFEVIRTDSNISQLNGDYYSYKSEIVDNYLTEPVNFSLYYNKYNSYIYSCGYLRTQNKGAYIVLNKINPNNNEIINKRYIKTYNYLNDNINYASPLFGFTNDGNIILNYTSMYGSDLKYFIEVYDKDTLSRKSGYSTFTVNTYLQTESYNIGPKFYKTVSHPILNSNFGFFDNKIHEFSDRGDLEGITNCTINGTNFINNEFYDIDLKNTKIWFVSHNNDGSIGHNTFSNNTGALKLCHFDLTLKYMLYDEFIVSELSNNNSYCYDMFIDNKNLMMYLLMVDNKSTSTSTKVVKINLDTMTIVSRTDLGILTYKFNYDKKHQKLFFSDDANKKIYFYNLKNNSVTNQNYFYNDNDKPLSSSSLNSYRACYNEQYDKYYFSAVTNDILSPDKFLFAIYNHIGERLNNGTMSLKDVVDDLLLKSGIDMNDVDTTSLSSKQVKGYVIANKTTIRACLEQLSVAYNFYAVESDFKIKFKFRGDDSLVEINKEELGANFYSKDMNFEESFKLARTQEIELPKSVNLIYADIEKDYQENTQEAVRHIDTTENVNSLTLPIAMSKDEAKQISERILYDYWVKRDNFEFNLYTKYLELEPGDVVTIKDSDNNTNYNILINSVDNDRGVLRVKATNEEKTVYTQSGIGAGSNNNNQEIKVISGTKTVFLDIPILRNEDDNAGNYITVLQDNITGKWTGSTLFSSNDEFGNYNNEVSFYKNCDFGNILNDFSIFTDNNTFDFCNEFNVEMFNGTLESRSDEDILNGYNLIKVGNEIMQFCNSELISDGIYKISRLLRGRFGTEIEEHFEGEEFVVLSSKNLKRINKDYSSKNVLKYYKDVSFGKSVASTYPVKFTNTSIGLKPYKVFNVVSSRDNNGNINIKFDRAERGVHSLLDNIDIIKLDSEMYELEIYDNDDNIVRLITSLTNEFNYSYQDQILDFGSIVNDVNISIYKVNDKYGRGYEYNCNV